MLISTPTYIQLAFIESIANSIMADLPLHREQVLKNDDAYRILAIHVFFEN